MPTLRIIFASTSGHTEYVVDQVIATMRDLAPSWKTEKIRAEEAAAEDLRKGDVLLLASSTWNTGSKEGQLNPHMFSLLLDRAKDIALEQKPVALIGLGDHRYFYTTAAAAKLEKFTEGHGGNVVIPTLRIVDEPYGQEEIVKNWAKQLCEALKKPSSGKGLFSRLHS